jgi:hypothetical protein
MRIRLQLSSEFLNADAEAATVPNVSWTPDLSQQLILSHDEAGVPPEAFDEAVFQWRQMDLIIRPARDTSSCVNPQVTELEHVGQCGPANPAP